MIIPEGYKPKLRDRAAWYLATLILECLASERYLDFLKATYHAGLQTMFRHAKDLSKWEVRP